MQKNEIQFHQTAPTLLQRLSLLTSVVAVAASLLACLGFMTFDYVLDQQGLDEKETWALLERDLGILLLVLLFSVLLAKVGSRRFTAEIAKPLGDLATSTQEIATTANFSQRLQSCNQFEIDILRGSFNDLLTAVEKRDADLKTAQGLLDGFVNHSPSVAYIKDAKLQYVFINGNYLRMLGKRRKEVIGYSDRELWPSEIAELLEAEDRQALTGSPHQAITSLNSGEVNLNSSRMTGHSCQHEFPTEDGLRTYTVQRFLIVHPDGSLYLAASGVDETDRLATQRHLKASEERYALAVKGASDGVWDWDIANQELYLSDRCGELLQLDSSSPILQSFEEVVDLVDSRDSVAFARSVEQLRNGESGQIEIEFRLKPAKSPGEEFSIWLLNRATALRDEKGQAVRVAGFISDITSRKKQEAQLRKDAFHDALTTLPNRALFMDRLNRAWDTMKRNPATLFGILFLDLDGFKAINDTLGHAVGDELLIEVSRRLMDTVRTEDTVARFGGDEFAILIEDLHEAPDSYRVASRILQSLSQNFELGPHVVKSASSIGIALSGGKYTKPEQILADADTAMYLAKRSGKGTYRIFDESMDALAKSKLAQEKRLKEAFGQEGAFFYEFLPIVDSHSPNAPVGLEALLRWKQDDGSVVLAEDFIQLAEDAGLLTPLAKKLVPEVLDCWGRWGLTQRGLHCTLNLSVRQFQHPSLLNWISETLEKTKFPPHLLRFDIPEAALARDRDGGRATIDQLAKLGCRVGLDGFGLGTSSIDTLCHCGFSYFKSSSQILLNPSEAEPRSMIESLMLLSKAFGLEFVMVGVQEAKYAELALKGSFAQGLHFGNARRLGSWVD
jgi:diguanylate cyclase (GGDEF)-like protein/PAS domain S-box-containing protein